VIQFKHTSRVQAWEFRDYVRARELFKLQELARRIVASGGSVDELDASFASLVPLWEWFVDFAQAGCPGVDSGVVPARWRDLVAGGADTPERRAEFEMSRKARVVAEGMEHYLRLVWDRYAPPTSWEIYITPERERELFGIHHATGITAAGRWREVNLAEGRVNSLLDGRGHADRADGLVALLMRRERWTDLPVQERGPSVLAPYLDMDLGPIPEAAAISPVWVWPQVGPAEVRAGRKQAPGEPVLLWRGTFDDLERPELLGVLDAGAVTEALAELGFVGPEGAPLDEEGLMVLASQAGQDDGDGVVANVAHRDEAAQAGVVVVGGTVRMLQVEPFDADRKTWTVITKRLRALASSQKARFIKESHMQ